MGDSEGSISETKPIDIIFSVHSIVSTEDPPPSNWSSLETIVLQENKKKVLYRDGLYDPGSGEICAQDMTMSASSVLRHPLYKYPAIADPGIEVALLRPERQILYPQDGQALYLATCEKMNQCPVRSFYRGLLGSRIDLQYYGINPNGFRAMAKALQYNNNVEVLNLTDNFLSDDACYHMGDMLVSNKTITELNLRGCRIGPQGARRLLCNLPLNTTLTVLDLSYNKLGDDAMEYLAKAIIFGITVVNLNLSYNDISGKGFALLAEPFETHNNFTHLDLSWNKLFTLGGHTFLAKLSENTCLEVLNLSWNSLSGPRMSQALSQILLCPLLRELNLRNNRLEGQAITTITESLTQAKKLHTLDLSNNPLSPHDALTVMEYVAKISSNVKHLIMENVFVSGSFLFLLERTKRKKSKKDLVVTYGGVVGVFKAKGPDAREVVLNRVVNLTKSKKNKAGFAMVVLQLKEDNQVIMDEKELTTALEAGGVHLDEDLVSEICNTFPASANMGKIKKVNIPLLAEYTKRIFPDVKLIPLQENTSDEPLYQKNGKT